MPTHYDHGQSDQDYFGNYGRNRKTVGSRIGAIFSNRGLSLAEKRRKRLIDEVLGGRGLDDIRSHLAPYGEGGATGGSDFLDDTTRNQVESALEAINAEFAQERKGLESQRGSLRRAFELFKDRTKEEEARALETSTEQAAGAGRIHSGLHVEDQARLADTFADEITQARAKNASKLRPIEQALATIDARRSREREATAREVASQLLGDKEAIAAALELA